MWMTLIPVTVTDPLGRSVLGLTPVNFRLFDEQQPRQIISFSRTDAPVWSASSSTQAAAWWRSRSPRVQPWRNF